MRLNAIDYKNNSEILRASDPINSVVCSLHGIRLSSEQNMIIYIMEYPRLGNNYFPM